MSASTLQATRHERALALLTALAALLLVAFAVWAVLVAVRVRAVRAEVEQNVRWLGVVSAVQARAGEIAAAGEGSLDEARVLEALDEIERRVAALAGDAREGRARVEALRASGSAGDASALGAWCAGFVPQLRQRTRELSEQLAADWSSIELVFLGAVVLAGVALALLVVALRNARRLRETSERLADAQVVLAESERLTALGRSMAQLSHELNNPLNVIANNVAPVREHGEALVAAVDALSSAVPSELAREVHERHDVEFVREDLPAALAAIGVATDRVRAVFADLASFSRGAAPTRTEEDLGALAQATLAMVRRTLPEGVSLDATLEPVGTAAVFATSIGQVMHNLVKNAVEAVGEGGTVRVRLEAQADHVLFTVEDDGPGVPAAIRARVFEPFFTTKRDGKGTGLGLSVSRHVVVQRHGGTLELVSPLEGRDRGTRFEMRLPRIPSHGEGTAPYATEPNR